MSSFFINGQALYYKRTKKGRDCFITVNGLTFSYKEKASRG